MISVPDESKAIDLIHRTKDALFDGGKLRLHKVSSNSRNVLASLPPEDLNKSLTDINLVLDFVPLQNCLGLSWNIETDTFSYKFYDSAKPLTKREV